MLFEENGCRTLLIKELAPNDDPKHGVYLAPGFEALNLIPHGPVTTAGKKRPYAPVRLFWLSSEGKPQVASKANLVLYPQYPEVRLSGFLSGCPAAPSQVMNANEPGRLLFLGLAEGGEVFAWSCDRDDELAHEVAPLVVEGRHATESVFVRLALGNKDDQSEGALLEALGDLHRRGWVPGRILRSDGTVKRSKAANAAGPTLEAEFGIPANSLADADYRGWELKSISAKKPNHVIPSKAISVITPNPEAGFFATHGVEAFIRRYGYPDQNGIADRLNVGGTSTVNKSAPLTGLIMRLTGFTPADRNGLGTINDFMGGAIELVDQEGRVAASWGYPKMLSHWEKKHSRAAYVPVQRRDGSDGYPEFLFGDKVWLGVGTDFVRFLSSIAAGSVYHDPGHKLVKASTPQAKAHSRSQFRINWKHVDELYAAFRHEAVR